MKIEGKTAVVTGGASGLGAGTVKRLHRLGTNIVIADINEETGVALATELGDGAVFVKTNVTVTEEIETGMTLPIARDLSIIGVRICTIAPGMFDTRGVKKANPL